MSAVLHNDGLVVGAGERTARIDKAGPIGLLIGIIGAVACAGLWVSGNGAMAGSWMFGWYFWLTITMGMFGLTILCHTIRPTWAVSLLRLFEAGGGPSSILLIAILFLPIVAQPGSVYEWAHDTLVNGDKALQIKHAYLNFPFWAGRAVAFFAIWIAFSAFLKNSVRRQEANGDKKLEMGRSSWGAFGIVLFMLTYTFAIIDWLLSMEAHFSSTMFGLWQIVASALGAMSFCVVVACLNAKKEPYTEIMTSDLTKDWGNILFMLTMLWAYTAVSQYLIIWNGNLPETAQYYARRGLLMWNAVGMITIVGQFLVPWMSLLSPRVKRYPQYLRQIAGWIFVIHIVDIYLAVGPAIPTAFNVERAADIPRRAAGQNIIFDLLALVTVGGFWLWMFANNVKKAPLLVSYDQRLQEAKAHAH